MSTKTSAVPVIRVRENGRARWDAGHPWVFRNELVNVGKVLRGLVAGDEVTVALNRSGEVLGRALWSDDSLIAARIMHREDAPIDARYFVDRLSAALAHRASIYPGETTYRWVHGESDGVPGLVLDRYDDVLVMRAYTQGIERRIDLVLAAIDRLVPTRAIYFDAHFDERVHEGLPTESRWLRGSEGEPVTVTQDGVRMRISTGDGHKGGAYLDQRVNRRLARDLSRGQRVLDVCCYTGAFGLYALAGGAEYVRGLDASQRALDQAAEHVALNGFEARAEWQRCDVLEALPQLATSEPRAYGLVVLDPPALARGKAGLGRALRAYAALNAAALELVAPGGHLMTFCCSGLVSSADFLDAVRAAVARQSRRVRVTHERTLGASPDHPVLIGMRESEYLRGHLLRIWPD